MTPKASPSAIESEQIRIRCPQCHIILCTRRLTTDGWVLYFYARRKKRKTEIYTSDEIALKCGECETWNRITPQTGITESYRNEYYGKRTQGRGADTKHIVESVTS